MKVLVVTNIRLYREGVAEALRRFPDVEEAVTAATGAAAVVTARRGDCDVVMVDMSLADSADTVRALGIARPGAERCGARGARRRSRFGRVRRGRDVWVFRGRPRSTSSGEALRSDNIAARLALLLGPVRFGGADQRF